MTRLWSLFGRPLPNLPPGSVAWARRIVDTIPASELVNHAETFAEQALRTTNPERRAQHWAKFRAAMARLDEERR